jgi:hypothetical protein
MKQRWSISLTSFVGLVLLAACAPTAVMKGAQLSYQDAKKAGAKEKAPYEFYASKVYLDLADLANREKAYPSAKGFAEKSQELSRQAFEKAGGGVK